MPEVIEVDAFEIDGQTVTAPGFTREQFLAFVARAVRAQLRTMPAGTPATVLVQSGSSSARYAVTRTGCTCHGGRVHGHCYHRAYVIWLHDVRGIDVGRVSTIGVSPGGVPRTVDRPPAPRGAA